MISTLNCPLVPSALSLCFICLFADSALAERLSATELLDRVAAARKEPAEAHFTVRTTVETDYADQPQEYERYEMLQDIFVEGERISGRGVSENIKGTVNPNQRESSLYRVWDGERGLEFQESPSSDGPGIWTGNVMPAGNERSRLRAFYTGAEMTGVFHGDQLPYWSIVRDAADLRVKKDKKAFPGTEVYRVEATTPRGHYTVWVDPALEYHLRKAVVRRGAEDYFWGQEKLSELRWLPKESWDYVIAIDSFEELGGQLLPTRANARVEAVFRGRGPGGSRTSTALWDIQIEQASFAPNFDALGAFVVPAPEGTPVIIFDENGRSSSKVVWTRDGLDFDAARGEAAWAAQQAAWQRRGSRVLALQVYDAEADGRTLLAGALETAAREGKRVLIAWGANWCGWCLGFDRLCSQRTEIMDRLEADFVQVHMDVGRRDNNVELGQELGVEIMDMPIPHFTVLEASGAVLAQTASAALVVPGGGGQFVYSAELIERFLARYAEGD